MLSYQLSGCSSGEPVIRTTYAGAVEGMVLWTHINFKEQWQQMSDAKLGNYSAVYTLVDNGPYDADPRLGYLANQSGPGNGNGKKAQAPLQLSAKKTAIKCGQGQGASLKINGGSGVGKVKYKLEPAGGAKCKIVRNDGARIKAKRGQYNGTCSVWAIKGETRRFNATSSNPVTLNVSCNK